MPVANTGVRSQFFPADGLCVMLVQIRHHLAHHPLRLAAQPLAWKIAEWPAKPLQRVDRVIAQVPARGRLSSHDTVTLIVPKPLHGVIPKLTGLTLRQARAKLAKVKLLVDIAGFTDGRPGRIVTQSPVAGLAARPNLTVSVVVGRG